MKDGKSFPETPCAPIPGSGKVGIFLNFTLSRGFTASPVRVPLSHVFAFLLDEQGRPRVEVARAERAQFNGHAWRFGDSFELAAHGREVGAHVYNFLEPARLCHEGFAARVASLGWEVLP